MSILGRIEIEIDFYFDFVSTIARLYSIIFLNILQILNATATDSTIQNTSNILQILHNIAINILHI